jgi:hypothetical protein
MSSINEAYARIDYATILELQDRINKLENIIESYTSDTFSNLEGAKSNVRGTKIFTETITVGEKDSKVNVVFGSNFFGNSPTVTATIRDINNKLVGGTDLPVILISQLDKNKAQFVVKRKKEASLVLHIIAIGESAD